MWAASALRPLTADALGGDSLIPAAPVTLGKWWEDRSSFQTLATSRVPVAPPTGKCFQPKFTGAVGMPSLVPDKKPATQLVGGLWLQILAPGCTGSRVGLADLPPLLRLRTLPELGWVVLPPYRGSTGFDDA